MKSPSQVSNFRAGDIVRLTPDMISFYTVYDLQDDAFRSGSPVLLIEIADKWAVVQDSTGSRYSVRANNLQHA